MVAPRIHPVTDVSKCNRRAIGAGFGFKDLPTVARSSLPVPYTAAPSQGSRHIASGGGALTLAMWVHHKEESRRRTGVSENRSDRCAAHAPDRRMHANKKKAVPSHRSVVVTTTDRPATATATTRQNRGNPMRVFDHPGCAAACRAALPNTGALPARHARSRRTRERPHPPRGRLRRPGAVGPAGSGAPRAGVGPALPAACRRALRD